MRVVDRLAEFEYVVKGDRELPNDEQTVWKLRGLPYDTQQKLDARVSPSINMPGASIGEGEDAFREALGQANVKVDVSGGRTELQFDILRNGLVGVENLTGPDGEEIPYPGKSAPAMKLKNWLARWIPSDIRNELANEIIECSTLKADDAKN